MIYSGEVLLDSYLQVKVSYILFPFIIACVYEVALKCATLAMFQSTSFYRYHTVFVPAVHFWLVLSLHLTKQKIEANLYIKGIG